MLYEIVDSRDPTITYKMGIFNNPLEVTDKINEMFKQKKFRIWLKEGTAVLREIDGNKELVNHPVVITGEGSNRIAKLGS